MKIILERIEIDSQGKKVFVFECQDAYLSIHEINMPKELANKVKDGDIVECSLNGDVISSAIILTEETEAKREDMKNRLKGLFNRRK